MTRKQSVLEELENISMRHGLERLASHLTQLRTFLGAELNQVERHLSQIITPKGVCADALTHMLQAKGKRIRPICVLLASRLQGPGGQSDSLALAVAAELVHNATLLHDDVIDEATHRRGQSSVRMVYGNSASILAGDYLLVQALEHVHRTGYHNLLSSLLHVVSRMVAAESMQLTRRGYFDPQRSSYLEIIEGKTAALFAWSLEAGGQISGLLPNHLALLREIGLHLGMSFQLVDDIVDVSGDPAATGKNTLNDLREGKATWPIILAIESQPHLREMLCTCGAPERELSPAQLAQLIDAIDVGGALQKTRQLAREHANKAIHKLALLPISDARTALQWVIESTVERLF